MFTNRTRSDPGCVSSQCRGIAAAGIAGRSWETGTEPRGCLGGEKTLSSHKDTPRGAEGNKYPFFSDTLPPSQVGRYLEATRSPRLPATETRRAGCPELHNSKHLSRTQGSAKARARVDLSVSSLIPTTQAQNHPIFSVHHLGTALPPVRWRGKDGQPALFPLL